MSRYRPRGADLVLLNKGKEFYTIKELINAGFGSRSTIHRHIKEDGLPACKIGYRVLIPREPFEGFVNAHRQAYGKDMKSVCFCQSRSV